MKKYLIALCTLCLCLTASAGKKTTVDLTCLKGQSVINLEVDWSNLTINNLSVDDWFAYRQAEQPENDAIEELEKQCKPQVKKLTQEINKKIEKVPLALVVKEGCKYTLRICPLTFDKKGNNTLRCLVINNETEEIIADFKIKGEGGHWGSLSNLWGDGFEDSGEKIGDIIKKAVKKQISVSE